ncbi:phosphate regulon sensor domain protein, partial [Vibrio parahaemolyticus V-223/04]
LPRSISALIASTWWLRRWSAATYSLSVAINRGFV